MDVRIEAAPMAADVNTPEAVVVITAVVVDTVVIMPEGRVASFSCPSIAGTSISAVSPDYDFIGGTAKAAA